jgi:hypothetical protein
MRMEETDIALQDHIKKESAKKDVASQKSEDVPE